MATMVKSNPWATVLGKKSIVKSFPFSNIKNGNLTVKGNEGMEFQNMFRNIFLLKSGKAEMINLDPTVPNRVSGTVGKEVPRGKGTGVATGISLDLAGQARGIEQTRHSRGNTAFIPSIPKHESAEVRTETPHLHDQNDGIKRIEDPKNPVNGQDKSRKVTVSRFVSNPGEKTDSEHKTVFQPTVEGGTVSYPHSEILGTETASSEALEGNEKPRQTARVSPHSKIQKVEREAGSGLGVKASMKGVHHEERDVPPGSIQASSQTMDDTDASEDAKMHRPIKKAVVKDGSRPIPYPHVNSETSERIETLDPASDVSEMSIFQDSEAADRGKSIPKRAVKPLHQEGYVLPQDHPRNGVPSPIVSDVSEKSEAVRSLADSKKLKSMKSGQSTHGMNNVPPQDHPGNGVPSPIVSDVSEKAEVVQSLPDGKKHESVKSARLTYGVNNIQPQDHSRHGNAPPVVFKNSEKTGVSQPQADISLESMKSEKSTHRVNIVVTPPTAYDTSVKTEESRPGADSLFKSNSQSTDAPDAQTFKSQGSAPFVGMDGKVLNDHPENVIPSSVASDASENTEARQSRADVSLKSMIQSPDAADSSGRKTKGSGTPVRLAHHVPSHDHQRDEVDSTSDSEKSVNAERNRVSPNAFEKSVTQSPKHVVGSKSSRIGSVKNPVDERTTVLRDTSEKTFLHLKPESAGRPMPEDRIERMVFQDTGNRRMMKEGLSSGGQKMERPETSPLHDGKNHSIQSERDGGQGMPEGMLSSETEIVKDKPVVDSQKWTAEDGAPKVVFHNDRVQSSVRPNAVPAGAREPGPPVNGLLAGQIGPSMVRMVREGRSKVTIALRPRQLGRLRMVLVSEEGRLDAKLFVESSQVKELIDRALPDMRAGLEKEGYRIQNFDVHVNRGFPNLSDRGAGMFREGRGGYQSAGGYSDEAFQEDTREENRHGDGVRYFGYNSMELVA